MFSVSQVKSSVDELVGINKVKKVFDNLFYTEPLWECILIFGVVLKGEGGGETALILNGAIAVIS